MKIKKFNENLTDYSDYKEYDEYSYIDMDIINTWNTDFLEINNFISNFSHEIKIYNDFMQEYVICDNRDNKIIPSNIKMFYEKIDKKFEILFYDVHKNIHINSTKIKYIKNIKEIAESDQKLFLELYNTYIKEFKAPYMETFGKEEFEHLFTSKKYNL